MFRRKNKIIRIKMWVQFTASLKYSSIKMSVIHRYTNKSNSFTSARLGIPIVNPTGHYDGVFKNICRFVLRLKFLMAYFKDSYYFKIHSLVLLYALLSFQALYYNCKYTFVHVF